MRDLAPTVAPAAAQQTEDALQALEARLDYLEEVERVKRRLARPTVLTFEEYVEQVRLS